MKKNIIFSNKQCPGDIVAMQYGVNCFAKEHKEYNVNVETTVPDLWIGNPYIKHDLKPSKATRNIKLDYRSIHRSNQNPVSFLHAFRETIENVLKLKCPDIPYQDTIHITEEEKGWFSAPREILGHDYPYWVINSGYKKDFTAKQWDFNRYQQLVTLNPNVFFVQVGLTNSHHVHKPLVGSNVINLLNKTDNRQLIRLVYNSFGVITPVSYTMMLAYCIPPHPRFKRKSRGCIVIAGGREPNHWQQPPGGHYLHTCGMLPCCDYGGCWKSRVIPIGDNDDKDKSLCAYPVKIGKQTIAKCMDMISFDEVDLILHKYMENL